MFLLLASIAALCAGPALALVPGRRQQAIAAIDGFVVVAVGGLVIFDILPHSIADAGWPAWVATIAGLLAPAVLHGPMEDCSERASRSLVLAGAMAFAVHAMFDGVALVSDGDHGGLLGWAVVLHRVLEGLAIWWLVRPHQGAAVTYAFLAVIAGATVVGFWCGDRALSHGFGAILAMLQAGVTGSLLHVLLRHAPPNVASTGKRWHLASGLGGLAAAGVLAVLLAEHTASGHQHDPLPSAALTDIGAAGHLCLGLLLSYAVTALVHALWESHAPAAVQAGHGAWRQALRGARDALTVAECSCGVVPLYRGLLKRHADRTGAVAFLFAAPLWGVSTLVLSWWMLGAGLTLLRAGATLILAVVAALVTRLTSVIPKPDSQEPQAAEVGQGHSPRGRFADALHYTLGEVLDRSSPWVLFGLVLAQWAAGTHLEAYRHSAAEVVLFALIATPFYLSATAATIVAAVFLASGVSPGAVLAFLLLSSALSAGTISLMRRQYGTRVCLLVTAGVWAVAVTVGTTVKASLPTPTLNLAANDIADGFKIAALASVAGLFLFSLMRQGVRSFLGQVALPNTMGSHSHHHNHGPAAQAAPMRS